MLYTAKCFWPGATEDEVRQAAARMGAAFRGALFLPADELVLCLIESPSPANVKQASEQAGFPCERVIESVCVTASSRVSGAHRKEQGCESSSSSQSRR
jgi:hypothetical protein